MLQAKCLRTIKWLVAPDARSVETALNGRSQVQQPVLCSRLRLSISRVRYPSAANSVQISEWNIITADAAHNADGTKTTAARLAVTGTQLGELRLTVPDEKE